MLTIEPTLATITAIKLTKEKTTEARKRYRLALLIVLTTEHIGDLTHDPEFTGTFWNGNGEPQMTNLYPLTIGEKITNVRVRFHDRLKEQQGLEFDAADISGITISPIENGRGMVELIIEGVHEAGARDAGDRLWRMISVPTEVSIEARQFGIEDQREEA